MDKILKSFVLLCVLLQGSSVLGFFQTCDMKRCHAPTLRDQLEAIDYIPTTEEQLESLCPPVLEALRCVAEQIEDCTKQGLFELAASENKTVALMGNLLLSIGKFVIDICDSNSELHRNYIASITCFKDLAVEPEATIKCHQEGNAVYALYAKSLDLLGQDESEAEERQDSEHWCMVTAYTFACFSAELQDKCGDVARTTFVDILKRFQSLKWNDCSDIDVHNLRTKFLDFLELEDDRRSIYSEVFNSRRRRK
ncbi:uncharacterized protein NPIL_679971 [Nephila pilipes]|uniref:Secreted protein n=1 Tax=Nephila pilipes TaxID=299642 RepID=A0A8X6NR34_NEPPI|nr:uncharacterized protein NPIL_679971 [Nephila pilipes]